MKKTSLIAALICSALVILSGCKEAGDAFVGKWDRVEKKIPDKEDSIEITREDGVFHINRTRWSPFKVTQGVSGSPFNNRGGGYVTERSQARAESENVLAVIGGGLPNLNPTYVIENGSLFTTQGDEYRRLQ